MSHLSPVCSGFSHILYDYDRENLIQSPSLSLNENLMEDSGLVCAHNIRKLLFLPAKLVVLQLFDSFSVCPLVTLVGFIFTFWYSLLSTSSILE